MAGEKHHTALGKAAKPQNPSFGHEMGWQSQPGVSQPCSSIACTQGKAHGILLSWASRGTARRSWSWHNVSKTLQTPKPGSLQRTPSVFKSCWSLSWGMTVVVMEEGICCTGWLVCIYIVALFSKKLGKAFPNGSLPWTTEFSFLFLKLGAEEGTWGLGDVPGRCPHIVPCCALGIASPGKAGHEGKGMPGGDWVPFSPQHLLVRLSCPLRHRGRICGDVMGRVTGSRFLTCCAVLLWCVIPKCVSLLLLYKLKHALFTSTASFMLTGIFSEIESSTYLQNNHFWLCLKCSLFFPYNDIFCFAGSIS